MVPTPDPRSRDHLPKVLVVDDDRFSRAALLEILIADHRVKLAMNGSDALRFASQFQPDLILLDIGLDDMSGLDVLRRLRSDPLTDRIPVIFVTGQTDAHDVARGLDLGAADYITKPVHPAIVMARIRTQLRLQQQARLLEAAALHDGLTGLYNRRALDDRFEMEWMRCLRSAAPLSLIMVDVDHFKAYNDLYGHMQGDDCLRAVAGALVSHLQRSSDMLARYGGEEFTALLPDTDPAGCQALAETLRGAVEGLGLEHRRSSAAPVVTISLGCATLVPTQAHRREDLLAAADRLLYEAKSGGRNRIRGVDLDAAPAGP